MKCPLNLELFEIDLDQIIGGEKKCGGGWKMLMECLAAGRAVSLPATANAASKVAFTGVYNYAQHRKQFKMPLIKMEAIQHKLVDMLFHTWSIHCSIKLTNQLLDSGEKPAVISAIMKQQTTERAKEVLNHGMDIYAGSAICQGPNNFISKFYQSGPVGITVEGSNTLTKNLIVFGQGINKSHPHISDILESILSNNQKSFKNNFNLMMKHVVKNYIGSIKGLVPFSYNNNKLQQQTVNFANLSNFVALLGGQLKAKQMISGDMADILSNLYLAHSINWYQENFNISQTLTNFTINRLCQNNELIFNRVIENYPIFSLKLFLKPMKCKIINDNYNDTTMIIKELVQNPKIINTLEDGIFIDGILLDLKMLNSLDVKSKEYNNLYNKVIQVGEYQINNDEDDATYSLENR